MPGFRTIGFYNVNSNPLFPIFRHFNALTQRRAVVENAHPPLLRVNFPQVLIRKEYKSGRKGFWLANALKGILVRKVLAPAGDQVPELLGDASNTPDAAPENAFRQFNGWLLSEPSAHSAYL